MHIFFQSQSSDSSDKCIKFLNLFDYFNENYLEQLKLFNRKWIDKKCGSNITIFDDDIRSAKRIKYKIDTFSDHLTNLKNILYDDDIESLMNVPMIEKLFLLYNFINHSFLNNDMDTKTYMPYEKNMKQNRELFQYILFIYSKIVCLLLIKENSEVSLIFLQELLQDISKNSIFSVESVVKVDHSLHKELELYSKDNKDSVYTDSNNKSLIDLISSNNNDTHIFYTTIKLFPYRNVIIIPTITNFYNIYILLFKKNFNISFDQLEYYEKQLMMLGESGQIFYNGWLLLAYAYYKLYSFKKSKKILKYCQKILYSQKRKSLENDDVDNFKINYFDTMVLMLQGCCYYNIVSLYMCLIKGLMINSNNDDI